MIRSHHEKQIQNNKSTKRTDDVTIIQVVRCETVEHSD